MRKPGYDRARVTAGIAHFGVGGFHRAHQALYTDDILSAGNIDWGICGVGVLPADRKMNEVMKRQNCLYTLVERSAQKQEARVIGSIVDYLFAPDEREKLLEKLASPETRIVSLTITEGGYCFNQGTGELDSSLPYIQHDLQNPIAPRSAFGLIVEGLSRRFAKKMTAFTVLSCDNLVSNGATARKMILAFASLRDKGLAKQIAEQVSFPNCMVDRITPVTTDEDRAMVAREFGVKDDWPVVCEPFRQWIIEDNFSSGRPAWETVGAQMTSDVHPYEMMKIRLLNASHSAMGYLGYLAGLKFIYEIMTDADFDRYIRGLMDEEVTPLLKPVPGIDLEQYKRTLVERFSNSTIKDQATRICSDGSGKMPKFILPSIREQLKRGGPIRRLTLCVASWFRFLEGTDEKGQAIPLEDPMGKRLRDAARAGREDPRPLLALTDIFGDLGQSQMFVAELSKALASLYRHSARRTLKDYFGG